MGKNSVILARITADFWPKIFDDKKKGHQKKFFWAKSSKNHPFEKISSKNHRLEPTIQ